MSRNKTFMRFTAVGRHLFHNRAGRNLLDLFIGMLYIDAVRKVVFALADSWIQRGSFWRGSERPGWGRINSHYQQVARAALHSLERGIGSEDTLAAGGAHHTASVGRDDVPLGGAPGGGGALPGKARV